MLMLVVVCRLGKNVDLIAMMARGTVIISGHQSKASKSQMQSLIAELREHNSVRAQ